MSDGRPQSSLDDFLYAQAAPVPCTTRAQGILRREGYSHNCLHSDRSVNALCHLPQIIYLVDPAGYDTVRSDPTIVELAEKYKVSPAQIILAWHVARGVVVVPRSSNASRQKDNLNVGYFSRSMTVGS